MTKFSSFARPWLIWLFLDARLGWLTVAPFFLLFLAVCLLNASTASISGAGGVLQLLGIGTVVWGLRKTQEYFTQPGVWSSIRGWFEARPGRKKYVLEVEAGAHAVASSDLRSTVRAKAPDGATIEERVVALERNIGHLDKDLAGAEQEVSALRRSVNASLKQEALERAAGDQALQTQMKHAGTGGLHVAFIGAIWLFFGVVLSTWPSALAAGLGRVF